MPTEKSVTVIATVPCAECKTVITQEAYTEAAKKALYASLKMPWYCDACIASKSRYWDYC